MLLVGSHAMVHWGVPINRTPSDFDYICTIDEYENWIERFKGIIALATPMNNAKYMHVQLTDDAKPLEFEIAWPGTTAESLLEHHRDDPYTKMGDHVIYPVATMEEILMMKLSHRYLRNSPHFLKTMSDIHLLRSMGVALDRDLRHLMRLREKETYTYNHPKLNQDKKTFFTDSVDYTYEHDDIHAAVAIGHRPAYTYFKVDGEEVRMSRVKWEGLPPIVRIRAVAEESMVLAIERSLIPHPGVLSPEKAFLKALEKVCTSITSGYFREFAWENYHEVAKYKDSGFYERFVQALENNQVRLFGEAA